MIEQITKIEPWQNLINGQVVKLGIQAPAGTKFYLNEQDMDNDKPITMGKYGIYELDFSGLNYYISWLSFAETDAKVIVDIIYKGGTSQ